MDDNHKARDSIELVASILLAAATVASAWCAYQSALWNGEQIRAMAKSNEAHFAALQKSNVANSLLLIDVSVFLNYIKDRTSGDINSAEYVRRHARPEFRPALEGWIADTRAGKDTGDGDLPFRRPDYRIAEMTESKALDRKASTALAEANRANGNSDLFVMHTVFFALALFFLGTAGQTNGRLVRRAMLVFGALAFTVTMISMTRIPRGHPERLRGRHADTATTETNP
jgi:hypothetical protein